MIAQNDQTIQQDFNLDVYRNLLERLQMSKRNEERLIKKLPVNFSRQLA